MTPKKKGYEPIVLPEQHPLSADEAKMRAKIFFDQMSKRHSIREYAEKDIDEELIYTAIATAARAPSGANQQPWHFVAIRNADMKQKIREAAEAEETAFYDGGGGDEWLAALEPIGTGPLKPHLTKAPGLSLYLRSGSGWLKMEHGISIIMCPKV